MKNILLIGLLFIISISFSQSFTEEIDYAITKDAIIQDTVIQDTITPFKVKKYSKNSATTITIPTVEEIMGWDKRNINLNLPTQKRYKFNYNSLLLSSALGFTAGVAKGTRDVLAYHTENFFRVHPNANRKFFDTRISWKNKYKDYDNGDLSEAFFLSKDLLVIFTDANHGLDMVQNLSLVGGTMVICLGDKRPWWEYGINFAAMFISRSAGFNLMYNVIYK